MTPKAPVLIIGDEEIALRPYEPVELRSERTVIVEALEMGRIVHPVYLNGCITPVCGPIMLVGNRGVFLNRSIWVEVSMVEDGVLETPIFNMGNIRIRVEKNDCISQLVWLAKPVYHTLKKERKR